MEGEKSVFYHFIEVQREETCIRDWSLSFSKAVYTNWYGLFSDLLSQHAFVILDEFQNLETINNTIFSSLQHAWDECESDCKLILLGSYVGMMKKLFLDAKLPLFGRKDWMINLQAFPIRESIAFLRNQNYPLIDAIESVFIVGGIPNYLKLFETFMPLKEKIFELFLESLAPLREESKNLLIQEFGSEHRSYFSILRVIAGGRKSLSEIQDLTAIPATSLSKFLGELENEYELIAKSLPLLSMKSRDHKYKIIDPLFNFQFHFIDRHFSDFEFDANQTYDRVFPLLKDYFGICWEEFCIRYLKENPSVLPFIPEKIGKTWGNVRGTKDVSFDIDVVAYDHTRILFGECKWTEKKVAFSDFLKLKERSTYLTFPQKNIYFAIFSKSGFEDSLLQLNESSLLLFTPETLFASAYPKGCSGSITS